MKKYKPYVISILIALLVGGLSALSTKGSMDIYKTLNSPPLSPPSVLFPIVWSILFVLMGISAALVYVKGTKEGKEIKKALTLYSVNLIMNFLWSIIFFNLRMYLFSAIWLVGLIIVIYLMIKEFKKISPISAYLQIPYLLWCIFALYLNIGIYLLN